MLSIDLVVSIQSDGSTVFSIHYELYELRFDLFEPLPESLRLQKSQILADFKDALIAFENGELHASRAKPVSMTFGF